MGIGTAGFKLFPFLFLKDLFTTHGKCTLCTLCHGVPRQIVRRQATLSLGRHFGIKKCSIVLKLYLGFPNIFAKETKFLSYRKFNFLSNGCSSLFCLNLLTQHQRQTFYVSQITPHLFWLLVTGKFY